MYNHRGQPTGTNHRPTPRSVADKRMQAREDSYGESGEYEAEAKYASDYQKSVNNGTYVADPLSNMKSRPKLEQAVTNQLIRDFPTTDPRTAPRRAKGILLAHEENRAPGLNPAVKSAGGTGNYIGKAVKNRNSPA